MELLRLSRAARRLGVHPVTLRLWADSGKIPVTYGMRSAAARKRLLAESGRCPPGGGR